MNDDHRKKHQKGHLSDNDDQDVNINSNSNTNAERWNNIFQKDKPYGKNQHNTGLYPNPISGIRRGTFAHPQLQSIS